MPHVHVPAREERLWSRWEDAVANMRAASDAATENMWKSTWRGYKLWHQICERAFGAENRLAAYYDA